MTGRLTAAALLSVLFVAPAGLMAQTSRAEVLERQRAEKAATLQPYRAGRVERALLFVEQTDPLAKIAPYNGFFVDYGYTEKPIGSGIALSAGYRHDLFDRRARMVLEGGVSVRNYRLGRVDFSLPYLLDERLEVGAEASYRWHPQEDFFGLGSESLKADRTSFRYEASDYQGRVVLKPRRPLRLGVSAGLLNPSIGRGTDKRYPSLEERFSAAQAPGLLFQPNYSYGEVFAALDTRDQDGNPRSGSFMGVAWRRYTSRGVVFQEAFRRLEADAQQFFPIFDKKRVIALRGHLTSTAAYDGGEVPFYFQPTLGGSDSLRSYSDFRFRDRHSIFLNAEYRWEAFSGLDMALFSDWGKVAPLRRDINLRRLKHAYGLGFRFNTYKAVFLRFDIAAGGGEGLRYFLKFSNVF